MRWVVVLVAVALAGCAEDAGEIAGAEDGLGQDLQVEVTDDTGGIRGVVVNDAIVPVAGATVALLNTELTTTTDENGGFAFSRVTPGTYFGTVTKGGHEEVQFGVEVVAGVEEPEIVKVQLNRLFQADPYMHTIYAAGFFTCSQAGMPGYVYSSSPCHSFFVIDLDDYGVELEQERDFHANVEAGWQTLIFEMSWETTAQGTSERMGMSVSTYKPERNTNHWFASVASENPMRFQLDVGEMHATAQEGSGPMGPIPAEGMVDMSYYISVRPPADAACVLWWCAPPGLALDQSFETWHTQFYYAGAPEGWSVLAGDGNPF